MTKGLHKKALANGKIRVFLESQDKKTNFKILAVHYAESFIIEAKVFQEDSSKISIATAASFSSRLPNEENHI